MELSVPYNPQQNGVAEIKNRCIIESTEALIHDQRVRIFVWVEEGNTTVYVQSICLEDKTLEEVFTGVKPKVGHLRIFGCPTYIHVPKQKNTKLEPSGRKGMFVEYSENSKAHRAYISGHRHIDISRYVTFDDEVAFQRSR